MSRKTDSSEGRASGPALHMLRGDDGMMLIEIVVSAAMLIVVALGVFSAFDAGTRATAEERHRARAQDMAQADVERMKAMRIADLSGLDQTRVVTQDGLNYTIRSQAVFGTETATTSTCAQGTGSRDTLQVTSTVTWASIGTRPPVRISSVVSPPNGSVVPNSGALLASVKDSRANGISGVAITGSGPQSFSGTTGTGGCVLWRNLPAGNYTLNFGGAAAGKVDPDGAAPTSETASVVAGSTNTVTYVYDSPGRITNIPFTTKNYSNTTVPSSADSVVVGNTGMASPRVFAAPGGVRAATITTPTTLFPFTSPYNIYAGTCGNNDPTLTPPLSTALGSATVPVGGSVTPATPIQLPALLVTVFSGNSSGSPGSRVANARVTAKDAGCGNVTRTLTTATDSQGRIPISALGEVGLPWGNNYEVCVGSTSLNRKRVFTGFDVVAATNTLDVYLGGGTSGSTCP